MSQFDYKQGDKDGRDDGGKGVKPLADSLLQRFYSLSYQAGYRDGYGKAKS